MPLIRTSLFIIVILVMAAAAHAAPLEAYGRLPSIEEIEVSPDGANLAFITVVGEERAVVVFNIDQKQALSGIKIGNQKVRDLTWADPQHLLITTSQTTTIPFVMGPRQEYSLMIVYDIARRKTSSPMEYALDGRQKAETLNVISGTPEPRTVGGRTMVFVKGVSFIDHRGASTLFAIDLSRGENKILDGTRERTFDWVIDGDGNVIAKTLYDESKQRWSLDVKKGSRWVEALGHDTAVDVPRLGGLTSDGKALIVQNSAEGGAWRAFNLADETWDSSEGGRYTVASFLKDPKTHLIIGGEREDSKIHYVFFNPEDERVWESIALAFDDENVELKSWSNDRQRIVIRVSGARDGAAYLLVDQQTHKAIRIGDEYAGVTAADVASAKPFVYAAADGQRIPAYLTLPRGGPDKKLPLVVLVHGGPATRDRPGFDWWAQALAARGYAVLQPQYRGSAGFGRTFMEAGFGEWGRKMQSDVSDGVRTLAKQGVIDPSRVCIVGGSYGGYAALAGVTLESGVYKCAVSVAGVSDPREMLRWTAGREWHATGLTLRYWDRFMGVSGPQDPELDRISPLTHAAAAGGPILLVHGKDDTGVPIEQSEDMAKALQRAGKSVQFVTLPSEDHWLSRTDTRLQMLKETVAFIERYNPPGESAHAGAEGPPHP